MRVGISLLTLASGDQGGAETYALELARALRESGTFEYRLFVPASTPRVVEGLETITVSAPFFRRGPARIPAMSISSRVSPKAWRGL